MPMVARQRASSPPRSLNTENSQTTLRTTELSSEKVESRWLRKLRFTLSSLTHLSICYPYVYSISLNVRIPVHSKFTPGSSIFCDFEGKVSAPSLSRWTTKFTIEKWLFRRRLRYPRFPFPSFFFSMHEPFFSLGLSYLSPFFSLPFSSLHFTILL